jgi:hypothetical protein
VFVFSAEDGLETSVCRRGLRGNGSFSFSPESGCSVFVIRSRLADSGLKTVFDVLVAVVEVLPSAE